MPDQNSDNPSKAPAGDQIDASPTKGFFVDMLTRDIPLEQAVLDLVDNSVDAARRPPEKGGRPLAESVVRIEFDAERFSITDNCGGFNKQEAKDYAFRFGRPASKPASPHSIGQFGVGMKRALFKFGRHFSVVSRSLVDEWAIDVAVDQWERNDRNWLFDWDEFSKHERHLTEGRGTEILVTSLRPEVSAKFSTSYFENQIISLIKSKHRNFLSQGLTISVNGQHISPAVILIAVHPSLSPGVNIFNIGKGESSIVHVKIITGVGHSAPKSAGWWVICNGRVVLEADRRDVTGWGYYEEENKRLLIPSFHNQFARYRGLAFFDSIDSGRVPWNTTKTDVDQDSPVWRSAFDSMREMMRPVINFLNDLDQDIDESPEHQSPLLRLVEEARYAPPESLTQPMQFRAPARGDVVLGPRMGRISYQKPVDDIDALKKELGLGSNKAVGEKTFDLILDGTK